MSNKNPCRKSLGAPLQWQSRKLPAEYLFVLELRVAIASSPHLFSVAICPTAPMAITPSPFLDPGTCATANNLGVIQLRRDHLIPAVLTPEADSDYPEGRVENTRFGSFPHSTLVGQPWGTQILASKVDTGSRGKNKKRKRDAKDEGEGKPVAEQEVEKRDIVKAAAASSGFAHLIPPTPETWTISLPHRTQVVYTPDYSYILQRLRARPGDHIIEAGAGSGSFTHAAIRAVYNGYPGMQDIATETETNGDEENAVGISKKRKRKTRTGGVYSFEYHEPRADQLKVEIKDHGLDPLVTVTHRDVYNGGFGLDDAAGPDADCIFLDLPAPWHALKHLTRSPPHREGATYFSFTQGPAEFFLLDTRRYRTPASKDASDPSKTMLGAQQLSDLLAWIHKVPPPGVHWKFIVTGTPFTKNWQFGSEDTWGGHLYERRRILEAAWDLSSTHDIGVVVLSGDRHEFAATSFPPPKDGKWPTSATVHEFSTSPLSMFYLPFRTYKETDDEDVCLKYLPDGNSKFGAVEITTPEHGEQSFVNYRLFIDGNEAWTHSISTPPGRSGSHRAKDAVWG